MTEFPSDIDSDELENPLQDVDLDVLEIDFQNPTIHTFSDEEDIPF